MVLQPALVGRLGLGGGQITDCGTLQPKLVFTLQELFYRLHIYQSRFPVARLPERNKVKETLA